MPQDPDKYKNKAARSKPSQQRGKERVRIILAAALELFTQNGFEVVTTNDIAEHAKIPIGSLYRYFPNKSSIISALTGMYVDDISDIFKEIGKHPMLQYLSWDEVLLLMVDGWISYSKLNGPFAFLYVERTNPGLRFQNQSSWERLVEAFSDVLKKRCPLVTDKQVMICFNLCLASVEMGINGDYGEQQGIEMCHEAVGVIAAYMISNCGSMDHHG